MQSTTLILAFVIGCVLACAHAEQQSAQQLQLEPMLESVSAENDDDAAPHARAKRTLFLKKKLIGAGLFGFGLGAAKGFKFGFHSAPEVHHVFLAPPPPPSRVYIEKPVFVEKPVYKPAHIEYEPAWSPPEPSPVYGPW